MQPDDASYNHIVDLDTIADIVFDLETVKENVTIKINISNLTLSIPSYENSSIGDIYLGSIHLLTSILQSLIISVFNVILADGFKINDLLKLIFKSDVIQFS